MCGERARVLLRTFPVAIFARAVAGNGRSIGILVEEGLAHGAYALQGRRVWQLEWIVPLRIISATNQ
jgi:hypothetical protein